MTTDPIEQQLEQLVKLEADYDAAIDSRDPDECDRLGGELDIVRGEVDHPAILAAYRQMRQERDEARAIVAKLPKDATGQPIEDCKTYYRRCANGVIPLVAYMSPQAAFEDLTPWEWHRAYPSKAAALAARESEARDV